MCGWMYSVAISLIKFRFYFSLFSYTTKFILNFLYLHYHFMCALYKVFKQWPILKHYLGHVHIIHSFWGDSIMFSTWYEQTHSHNTGLCFMKCYCVLFVLKWTRNDTISSMTFWFLWCHIGLRNRRASLLLCSREVLIIKIEHFWNNEVDKQKIKNFMIIIVLIHREKSYCEFNHSVS